MNELQVQITPALVTANFEELHAFLTVEVAKYDVVVTEATVKDAKKLATELNAVTKGINAVKKKQLEILEAPAKEFKARIAELNEIVQNGRRKIIDQVTLYEERTKDIIRELLAKTLEDEYTEQDVGEEYRTVYVDDLVLLGSLTKSGNLTGKAVDEVISRVAKAKAIEKAVELRTVQLENECYKAGLKVPLSVEYIKEFIQAEEDVYKERLNRLIRIELDRQTFAEEKAKKLADYEAQKLIDKANEQRKAKEEAEARVKQLEEQVEATPTPLDDTPIAEAPEGKKTLRIEISFDIIVREGAPEAKVLSKMKELLKNAGIPELNQIKIKG